MTALYLERYLNFGLTREELQSGKPIIGIAQTGSDLSPCNRHHLVLAERVREGIREAGRHRDRIPGPSDPGDRQASDRGARPQPRLSGRWSRSLRLSVDGVVLTIGCDKTTPACLMAAATVNIPAIALSGGPMLNGWYQGRAHRLGHHRLEGRASCWPRARSTTRVHRAGRVLGALDRLLQHHGHGHDHELAGRGAGHVAARLCGHPRALSRARADGLSRPASASSTWCART